MKINPDLYHGHDQYTNFFEGWYFKIVDATGRYSLDFIPGISRTEDAKKHHSFIQVIDLVNHSYHYCKYSVDDFYSNNRHLKVNIGLNEFSFHKIYVDFEKFHGLLYLGPPKKWPHTKRSPNMMRLLNYIPFLESHSHVCAIDGNIEEGHLKIGNQIIDFSNGKYYIEKNWRKSHPTPRIGIQSNYFEDGRATLTCSLEIIPLPIIKEFLGFEIGVTVDQKFYSFTTANHSKLNISFFDRDILLCVTKDNVQLILKTKSKSEDFIDCQELNHQNTSFLYEAILNAEVELTLLNKKNNTLIYHGIGKACGIKYRGDLSRFYTTAKIS